MKINKYYIGIFCLFLGLFVFQFSKPISYALQIIFLVLYLPWIITYLDKVLLNKYNIFFSFFFFFSVLSLLWAPSKTFSISAIIAIFQMLFYCNLIFLTLRIRHDFDSILFLLGMTIFIGGVVILIVTPFSEWQKIISESSNVSSSQGRLGLIVSMHPNELAEVLLSGVLIFSYYYFHSDKKVYLIPILLLSGLLFFTKSRTSLVLLLLGITLLYLIKNKKKNRLLIRVPIILLAIFLIVWLVQYNPFLYNLVGFRFSGLLGFNGAVDASTQVRSSMVSDALKLFSEHPIIGVGINNFRYYAVIRFGLFAEVYAHNNYVEILSTLGIIGFLGYYFPIFYSLVITIKSFVYNRDNLDSMYSIVFTLLVVRILGDISRVSYSLEIAQITNMFCFAWIIFSQKELKKIDEFNSIGFI